MTDNGSRSKPAVWQVVVGIIVVIVFLIGLFEVIDRVFSWGFFLLVAAGFGAWWFFLRKKG
jgi:hypothetical protein